jgi:hypothetical protein
MRLLTWRLASKTENRLFRRGGSVGIVYKVIELATVGAEEIEQALNEWTAAGWTFDSMQFAMRDGSKRPAMAFLVFTRSEETG